MYVSVLKQNCLIQMNRVAVVVVVVGMERGGGSTSNMMMTGQLVTGEQPRLMRRKREMVLEGVCVCVCVKVCCVYVGRCSYF